MSNADDQVKSGAGMNEVQPTNEAPNSAVIPQGVPRHSAFVYDLVSVPKFELDTKVREIGSQPPLDATEIADTSKDDESLTGRK